MVSIIIPTFNEAKNIERLLRSIKAQTYKSIEIIIVDDASTDKTIKIAKLYTDEVFKRKHAERSIQRNFGAEKSRGDYLLFLDADMELAPNVVADCLRIAKRKNAKGVTIAETTVADNLLGGIRKFEREMYEGDPTIEIPRFFERKVFFEFGGYDPKLTGPEDYDLPYRIGKKYKLSRSSEFIFHHEEGITLGRLLKKKFYYAYHGASYAQKHPELILLQGNLLMRKAYIRNWKKFLKEPYLGVLFVFVRILETVSAISGFLKATLKL